MTGCAKYSHLLENLNSSITIIEEAAEVLECLNITVLTKHTKQLILIGDHQQLRPHVESYTLEKNYNFAVSLFERLVINGINFVTLEKQRRMRSDFADFIRVIYGNKYCDHESVAEYENIKGVQQNLFFFDHKYEESQTEGSKSKTNDFEANFIVYFTKYFVQQGYQPEQISIICMYLGQVIKIKRLLSQIGITKTIVASVDNYQGEENDILMISLVRSNEKNQIGFTAIDNRICVALSRARMGMFIFGNFECLTSSKKGHLWRKMVTVADKKKCMINTLVLSCQNHKKETIVKIPEDFENVPEGGCKQLCNIRKPCGHIWFLFNSDLLILLFFS